MVTWPPRSGSGPQHHSYHSLLLVASSKSPEAACVPPKLLCSSPDNRIVNTGCTPSSPMISPQNEEITPEGTPRCHSQKRLTPSQDQLVTHLWTQKRVQKELDKLGGQNGALWALKPRDQSNHTGGSDSKVVGPRPVAS